MSFLRNIKNGSFWNIGFCEYTPEKLIEKKALPQIQWMKHPYKDRFFADPFILKVTETEIVVFVEEYVFDNPPGLIVELVLDKKSKRLKERYELLRMPTHLSYPAIIRDNDKVMVYPENGESGTLNVYEYDPINHKLVNPRLVIPESLFDSTICKLSENKYILAATKWPDNLQDCFAYRADSVWGPYTQVGDKPFQTSKDSARHAGNFFKAYGQLYRPGQDCSERYGGGISIMEFDSTTCTEKKSFTLRPYSHNYNLGLHTINFNEGLCVVDGYGYLYPTLGRIYASKWMEKIRFFAKAILRR